MTNLEFYKEEIKERLMIHGNILSTAVREVFDKHTSGALFKDGKSEYDVLAWLCEEHKDFVLNKQEKEYLSNVIRPFKNSVSYIVKRGYTREERDYEYLVIHYNDIGDLWGASIFPSFKTGTMYKGMELNKEYTLEELGL